MGCARRFACQTNGRYPPRYDNTLTLLGKTLTAATVYSSGRTGCGLGPTKKVRVRPKLTAMSCGERKATNQSVYTARKQGNRSDHRQQNGPKQAKKTDLVELLCIERAAAHNDSGDLCHDRVLLVLMGGLAARPAASSPRTCRRKVPACRTWGLPRCPPPQV